MARCPAIVFNVHRVLHPWNPKRKERVREEEQRARRNGSGSDDSRIMYACDCVNVVVAVSVDDLVDIIVLF